MSRGLRILGILGALVVIGAPVQSQNFDLAGEVDAQTTLGADRRTNAASTGSAISRSGYTGAMMVVVTGIVLNTAGSRVYVVLQDSSVTPSQAWTAVDSVQVDTVDKAVYRVHHRGTKRFLRAIQRATSSSADSAATAVSVLLVPKRARP